jgi:hypothetical protein
MALNSTNGFTVLQNVPLLCNLKATWDIKSCLNYSFEIEINKAVPSHITMLNPLHSHCAVNVMHGYIRSCKIILVLWILRLNYEQVFGPIEAKYNKIFDKIAHTLSVASLKLRHNWSRQPYGRKVLRVQRDLPYGDFGPCLMLKIPIGSIDSLIMA